MYKISSVIDNNKVFLIKRSELEGRIDPQQFHCERRNSIEILKLNNNTLKLKHVVKYVKLTTSEISQSDIYIGLENIESETGEYIQTSIKESISNAGKFKKGQILFPKLRPYLNKVYFAEFDGICSTEFHIFDSKNYNNEFLSIYLKSSLIVNQTRHLMTGNTLPRLQTEDINSLLVPEISLKKQVEIVEVYNSANIQKQKKEKEAKSILESIDKYLLTELGIDLPQRDNSFSNRVFEVKWSELSGDRFDAFSFFNNALKIEGGNFPNKKLRELATVNKGQSITSANVIEGDFPVIAGGKTSPYSHNEYNNKGKTITVSASGAYSGYVWYHNEKIFASDCSVIKSKDENVISMDYLAEILKLKQTEIYGLQQGAGQPHVYPNDLIKLNIPLPPLEVQNRITEHIFELREKAKELELEAKSVLKEAKQEIEKMILN